MLKRTLACLGLACLGGASATLAQVASFAEADENRDGWLVYKEFQGSEFEFQALDLNSDGALSANEYNEFRDQRMVVDTAKSLIHVIAASRGHYFKTEAFPSTQADMIRSGVLDDPLLDGWGNPILIWADAQFDAKKFETQNTADAKEFLPSLDPKFDAENPPKLPDFHPAQGLKVSNRPSDILTFYVARSAGMDQVFGTEDDILRS
ncbi:MAG: hypothetical protein KDB07_12565, partial [Planctomycetes bacterium]|nr:hypothetical protein [Planctomycetota bacterium]